MLTYYSDRYLIQELIANTASPTHRLKTMSVTESLRVHRYESESTQYSRLHLFRFSACPILSPRILSGHNLVRGSLRPKPLDLGRNIHGCFTSTAQPESENLIQQKQLEKSYHLLNMLCF